MISLGLNFGSHDSAAALTIDGKIIAAAEEERFTREKHTKKIPLNSITYCLNKGRVNLKDVDNIALFINPELQPLILPYTMFSDFPSSLNYLNYGLNLIRKRNKIVDVLKFNLQNKELQNKIQFVNHHYAHAASAYYCSPFDDAAILTIDGRGEYESIALFIGEGNTIKKISSTKYPHSIGYLYSAITKYLGFKTQSDEYKVMGLSAYGDEKLNNFFNDLGKINNKGKFILNLDYFDHHIKGNDRQLFSSKLVQTFGAPRQSDEPLTQKHADISKGLQFLTENLILDLAEYAKYRTGKKNLCLAGGVALNCLANQKLAESNLFDKIFVQPAANDSGTSIGAALYTTFKNSKSIQRNPFNSVYLGPSFSNIEIESTLLKYSDELTHTFISFPSKTAAELIANNKIIGWFQGEMEFGPRALGNRSILASASDAKMKDLVNNKIKFREPFRPFAPAVLDEDVNKYFNTEHSAEYMYPFMVCTAKVKDEAVNIIPAVTHKDQTGRLQIVEKTNNKLFWELISEYKKITNVGVILNTSFNINGEAIVCTPEDAIYNFMESGLDNIIIGNYLVNKKQNNKL
ncbi:MAG: carbamoyltransferase N-terminal domain-containing protein [Candidatus Woesearchaeota archaeon]|jgi:carbamoyltransferase